MKRLLALFACLCLIVTVAPSSFADVNLQGRLGVVGNIVGKSGYIDIEMVMPEEDVDICGIQFSYELPENFVLNGAITTPLKMRGGEWNIRAQDGTVVLDNDMNENIDVSNKETNGSFIIARLPITVKGSPIPAKYSVNLQLQAATKPISSAPWFTDCSSYFEKTVEAQFDYLQDMSKARVEGVVNKEYTGRARVQSLTVFINDEVLDSENYVVRYTNNIKPGLASVTIEGNGNYSGKITKNFYIYPETVEKLTRNQTVDSVALSWDKSSGADGYLIYRSTNAKSGFSLITTVTGGKTSYTNTGLLSGTTYYYRVIPYIANGSKRVYSTIYMTFSTKTMGYTVPKVSGFKASQSSSSVKLSWSEVDKANGYIIMRATSKNGKYSTIRTVESGQITSYTDKSAGGSSTYYYKIVAYRKYKSAKGKGPETVLSVSLKPATPKISSVKNSGIGIVTVSYAKANGAGYQVYYSTSKSSGYKCGYTGTSLAPKIKGLGMGKAYYFKVRTYSTVNGKKIYSSYSSVKSLKTTKYTAPKKVKISSAKTTAKKTVTVKWSKVSKANGYEVYYSSKKNSGYKKAYSGSSSSCKIKSLKKGKTYYVKVRAYVSSGGAKLYGSYSTPKKVKVTK